MLQVLGWRVERPLESRGGQPAGRCLLVTPRLAAIERLFRRHGTSAPSCKYHVRLAGQISFSLRHKNSKGMVMGQIHCDHHRKHHRSMVTSFVCLPCEKKIGAPGIDVGQI